LQIALVDPGYGRERAVSGRDHKVRCGDLRSGDRGAADALIPVGRQQRREPHVLRCAARVLDPHVDGNGLTREYGRRWTFQCRFAVVRRSGGYQARGGERHRRISPDERGRSMTYPSAAALNHAPASYARSEVPVKTQASDRTHSWTTFDR